MSQVIAPVVYDKKTGLPKELSPEVLRRAKEIVEQSGANSEARFREVTLGEITFRDQAEAYLKAAVSRKRKPLRDTVSIEGALSKRIDSLPLRSAAFVAPMERLAVSKLPEGSQWAYEGRVAR